MNAIYSKLTVKAAPTSRHISTPEGVVNAELLWVVQQFVNGVETGMIDSPADETLANITRRARAAIAKAKGSPNDRP